MKPGTLEQRAPGTALAVAALHQSGGTAANIKSATAATYTVGPEDVHHAIKVSETVENGAGRSKAVSSAATRRCPRPPSSPPR